MGRKFYFVLNAQGDVVQLRDSQNRTVANYHYDAWGKLLSITDPDGTVLTASSDDYYPTNAQIAFINPIRYRGYIYDNETGFYYLNTRYYDPGLRRFINADSEVCSTQKMIGYNLFTYCLNNPVRRSDPNGKLSGIIGSLPSAEAPFVSLARKLTYIRIRKVDDILIETYGTAYLVYKGYTLSMWMFLYAFHNDGRTLEYESLPPMLKDKLINSEDLHTSLQYSINLATENGTYWFDTQDQVVYLEHDLDLKYAINKAEFRAWGWIEDGRWKINIFVWDDYNFSEYWLLSNGLSFASLANDIGTYSQNRGYLTDYHWWIRYEYFF